MTTKKTTRVYVVTAHKKCKCAGFVNREFSFNLAVYRHKKDAEKSVKRMVDKYLTDPEFIVYNSGDNFVEYSLKGLEFDRFKYTYEIETHALL